MKIIKEGKGSTRHRIVKFFSEKDIVCTSCETIYQIESLDDIVEQDPYNLCVKCPICSDYRLIKEKTELPTLFGEGMKYTYTIQ